MVQVARWASMHRRRALNRLAARSEEDKDKEPNGPTVFRHP
jgi:hypothetical protein